MTARACTKNKKKRRLGKKKKPLYLHRYLEGNEKVLKLGVGIVWFPRLALFDNLRERCEFIACEDRSLRRRARLPMTRSTARL